MRDQYKVLAEKYAAVIENATQQGREIKGVFVPTEVENWINDVLHYPIYTKGAIRKIIGYKKADTDYAPEELNIIVNKIYNQWKNASFEEVQQAIKAPQGPIIKTLVYVRRRARQSPEEIKTQSTAGKAQQRIKNLNVKQFFNTGSSQAATNPVVEVVKIMLKRARERARKKSLPFFYDLNINRPVVLIKKDAKEAIDYLVSIWPRNNICPATGLRFILTPEVRTRNAPSLDKFKPALGYVKGNVAIISDLANTIKNAADADQVKKVYEYSVKGNAILSEIKNHANGFNEEIDNPVIRKKGSPGRNYEVVIQRIQYTKRHAEKRAKEKGLPFNITTEYLRQIFPVKSAMICPALGIPLIWSNKLTNNTPTLDRIDPDKGYVGGNVVFISHLANRIKNNATPDQILGVYNWMKANNAEPDFDNIEV